MNERDNGAISKGHLAPQVCGEVPIGSIARAGRLRLFRMWIERVFLEILTVETNQFSFAVDHCGQIDRSTPNRLKVLKRFVCVIRLHLDTFKEVREKKLAAVFEVRVFNLDDWLSKVGQLKQKLLFNKWKIARIDFEAICSLIKFVNE